MPKTFRKAFRTEGVSAHIRKRPTSATKFTYEVRYRANGYNVTATAKTLEAAKAKFIEKLHVADKQGAHANSVPAYYNEFAQYFFDTYYVEKVAPKTFQNVTGIFRRHVQPYFDKIKTVNVTPGMCKALLDKIRSNGHGKTADEVYSILNQTFKMAMAYNVIQRNPVAVIPYKQHERTNGSKLTLEEERKLLTECRPLYIPIFARYLYTGIRPGEIYSMRIEGPFVVCQNLKKKGQRYEEKKIPIIRKLQPYLELPMPHIPILETIRAEFNRILPSHTVKDCRRTFSTHCEECHVADSVRERILGHAPKNVLDKAYLELSDEFLLSECQKIDY